MIKNISYKKLAIILTLTALYSSSVFSALAFVNMNSSEELNINAPELNVFDSSLESDKYNNDEYPEVDFDESTDNFEQLPETGGTNNPYITLKKPLAVCVDGKIKVLIKVDTKKTTGTYTTIVGTSKKQIATFTTKSSKSSFSYTISSSKFMANTNYFVQVKNGSVKSNTYYFYVKSCGGSGSVDGKPIPITTQTVEVADRLRISDFKYKCIPDDIKEKGRVDVTFNFTATLAADSYKITVYDKYNDRIATSNLGSPGMSTNRRTNLDLSDYLELYAHEGRTYTISIHGTKPKSYVSYTIKVPDCSTIKPPVASVAPTPKTTYLSFSLCSVNGSSIECEFSSVSTGTGKLTMKKRNGTDKYQCVNNPYYKLYRYNTSTQESQLIKYYNNCLKIN